DLPLLEVDRQRSDVPRDLSEPRSQRAGVDVRQRILTVDRPDAANLSLDVLRLGVDRLVGGSWGEGLDDEGMRPRRFPGRAGQGERVRVEDEVERGAAKAGQALRHVVAKAPTPEGEQDTARSFEPPR